MGGTLFLRHVRIRHFLEVVLEVKRARYCDIKSKTEERSLRECCH
jgi:hypothetical protein